MIKDIMKNKFITGTLILLTGGFLSKFLGFILKIIITRQIGVEGIGLYSLVMPTFGLFITIATFSFPIAISKLVSMPKRSSKKIIFSIIPVSFLLNIITLIIIFIISAPLANTFLKEPRLYYPLLSIGFTLPFIGLSSIIKGYYWGKQRMGIYILSNIVEQIVRIGILLYLIPIFLEKSLVATISIIILVNIISETSSIIVMLLGLPKGMTLEKKDLKPSMRNIKDVMNISVPSTSSKVIGSIAHFLEPIILTNVLTHVGYSNDFIITEYGIINGYSLALLLLPQFFTQSISTALIPELSKNYAKKDMQMCKKRVKQIVSLSLLIGVTSTSLIFCIPEFFLNLIYNTTLGVTYIKILAPFLLLFFINTPITNALQAIDKSKESMIITVIVSIIRLSLVFILSFLKIGMYGLIIGIIVGLIISCYLETKTLKKALNN
jgi:stage V sporulation protein B